MSVVVELLGISLLLLAIVWVFLGSGRAEARWGRIATNVIGLAMLGFAAWRGFAFMGASTPEARAASGLSVVIVAELMPRRWRMDRATDNTWRAISILAACFAAYTLLNH